MASSKRKIDEWQAAAAALKLGIASKEQMALVYIMLDEWASHTAAQPASESFMTAEEWEIRRTNINAHLDRPAISIAEKGVGLPTDLYQSATFSALKPKAAVRQSLSRRSSETGDFVRLEAGYRGALTLRGPLLTQVHLSVLIGLFELAKGRKTNEWVELRPRRFAREILGWGDNTRSGAVAASALKDLVGTEITRCWGFDARPTTARILEFCEVQDDGSLRVKFHDTVLQLSRGRLTFLSAKQRSQCKLGLESWLAVFVMSSDCHPHDSFRKNGGYTVQWFRRLSGTPDSVNRYEFTRDLKAALNKLKQLSIIEQFRIKRTGDVYIWKKAPRASRSTLQKATP
ncbi:hypothetical protein [Povalibacter sp.]|uniref:hypothetical protein n=1 Tax=Povalibacter sp. TaxID=1962978 RepID=UPI002F42676A